MIKEFILALIYSGIVIYFATAFFLWDLNIDNWSNITLRISGVAWFLLLTNLMLDERI